MYGGTKLKYINTVIFHQGKRIWGPYSAAAWAPSQIKGNSVVRQHVRANIYIYIYV